MSEAMSQAAGHRRWVRISHWVIALSILTLAASGILILMVQPRLYWGEVGNDLTPALFELPISNNHRPAELENAVTFSVIPGTPVSANRNYEIFNENGWARSLHFLAAWFLLGAALFYALAGMLSGHLWRNVLPRARELAPRVIWQDVRQHLRLKFEAAGAGRPYSVLQKFAYAGVIFLALPFMVLTGLTMSPAVTAAYPILLDIFGGYQSARTLHFFGLILLLLFLLVHVGMVYATGFRQQLRAMTWGK